MKRFLSKKQVMELTALGEETIRRWENDDKFPKRIRLSPTKTVWSEDEVLKWQQQKLDER